MANQVSHKHERLAAPSTELFELGMMISSIELQQYNISTDDLQFIVYSVHTVNLAVNIPISSIANKKKLIGKFI